MSVTTLKKTTTDRGAFETNPKSFRILKLSSLFALADTELPAPAPRYTKHYRTFIGRITWSGLICNHTKSLLCSYHSTQAYPIYRAPADSKCISVTVANKQNSKSTPVPWYFEIKIELIKSQSLKRAFEWTSGLSQSGVGRHIWILKKTMRHR